MVYKIRASVALLVAVTAGLSLVPQGLTQTPTRPAPRFTPRLEPVAETRLLMEGLAHANFRGLERLLKKKPDEAEAWTFARGQALLIAETANLLMMRPPRNQGEMAWMERATDRRAKASARPAHAARARTTDHQARTFMATTPSPLPARAHQPGRLRNLIGSSLLPHGKPGEIIIISPSNPYSWWPVWLTGFIMAG